MSNKSVRTLLITLLTWAAVSQGASAATLHYTDHGTAVAQYVGGQYVYAGLYNITIDGNPSQAMCDDWITDISKTNWTATGYTYNDIVNNNAPVKFRDSAGIGAYKEAGWLFSQLGGASYTQQGYINQAVWKLISAPSLAISSDAMSWYNLALGHSDFDFSKVMMVWTPAGGLCNTSQELLTPLSPPSEVPVPAAVWLFGSGLVGLVGVARRRKDPVA